jgi:hypothetical protein
MRWCPETESEVCCTNLLLHDLSAKHRQLWVVRISIQNFAVTGHGPPHKRGSRSGRMKKKAQLLLSSCLESENRAERFSPGEVILKRMLRLGVLPRTSKCTSQCTSKTGLGAAGLGHEPGDRGLAMRPARNPSAAISGTPKARDRRCAADFVLPTQRTRSPCRRPASGMRPPRPTIVAWHKPRQRLVPWPRLPRRRMPCTHAIGYACCHQCFVVD